MITIPEIVKRVEDNITGRVANKTGDKRTNSIASLLEYVWNAGGGNHLEIGTLFGGSAIAVAILKKEYELSGIVMCIDPLNGYYGENRKDISGVDVSVETLFYNIRKFSVGSRISVIQSSSLSVSLMDIKFSTAYIDGEHKSGVPFMDWNRTKNLVTKYVVFDNYSDQFPDVQFACKSASSEYGWRKCHQSDIVYVVSKYENNFYDKNVE